MNMTLIETRQPSTGYGDYDSDYSDQMNNEDIMEVVEKIWGKKIKSASIRPKITSKIWLKTRSKNSEFGRKLLSKFGRKTENSAENFFRNSVEKLGIRPKITFEIRSKIRSKNSELV